MDTREICAIVQRVDTRFRRRLAGDRLFLPDELGALARAAAEDPRLWPVVNAGRAHLALGAEATRSAWDTAYQAYLEAVPVPRLPDLPPGSPVGKQEGPGPDALA